MPFPTILDASHLRLLIDAFKILLNGYDLIRKRKGEPNPEAEKEERAIGQAVQTAEEEMTAPDVDSQAVAQGMEERLRAELGAEAKDAIIQRALGIVALARPYEMESFRYCDLLAELVAATRAFFIANNVFRLRGEIENVGRFVPLRDLGSALKGLFERSGDFKAPFQYDRDIIDVSVADVVAILSSATEGLRMTVIVQPLKSNHMGGTYKETLLWGLGLVPGSEVNRLGFRVERSPQFHSMRDFDLRITLGDFRQLAFAVLGDLNGFASELALEERNFREELGPVLTRVLGLIKGNR